MQFLIVFGIVLLVFFALLIISLAIFFIFDLRRKKYEEFVLKNSVALQKILEINKKYAFYTCSSNHSEKHTYDNKDFYDSISCQDYLIYQLQFKKYDVLKDIKNVLSNKHKYNLYCNEVNSINCFGEFIDSTGKLDREHLLSLEKDMFDKSKLTPTIFFTISIYLYCSKINGQVYNWKHQTFNSEEILTLIKRLENKRGDFYNDRDIWDALCRVERGNLSNKMRFQIYERDGYRCCKCGKFGSNNDLEIDHIKPISKGGKTTYDNLQTLCKSCNKEKGNTY